MHESTVPACCSGVLITRTFVHHPPGPFAFAALPLRVQHRRIYRLRAVGVGFNAARRRSGPQFSRGRQGGCLFVCDGCDGDALRRGAWDGDSSTSGYSFRRWDSMPVRLQSALPTQRERFISIGPLDTFPLLLHGS